MNASSSTATTPAHENGYPHGHLGHLTAQEEAALAKFKLFLEEKRAYKPGPPASHDDPTLLRFLRARRWVVEDAYRQFKDTEDWRAANQIDTLYSTIDLDAYEQSRGLYPQWVGRRDRRGIPVYLFEIRHLDSKTINAYEKASETTYSKARTDSKTPARMLGLLALYENLTRFAQPLCTELTDREHARTPITLSTNIVDVGGVSLRQFWNLKAHMQAASQLATAHYPETLDRIFIIGAPAFFTTVWGWVKRWFDPITVSKIFILSTAEVRPTLEAFIDPKNIPRQYGGALDFSWGDAPVMDPEVKRVAVWENGHADFPKGPLYWRPVDGGKRLECVAVGTVNRVERLERVCTIPKAFPDGDVQPTLATGVAETKPVPAVSGTEEEEVLAEKQAPTPASSNGTAAEPDAQGLQNLSLLADNKKDDAAADLSEKVASAENGRGEAQAATAC